MAAATQDAAQSHFEMSLRDQLMAAESASETPSNGASYPSQTRSSPDVNSQIDPSIAGNRPPSPEQDQQQQQQEYMGQPMAVDSNADMSPTGRGAQKRELSTTKRAAQNRAAQRAFRQRKEQYITTLEKQVKEYLAMEQDFKALNDENYHLREYVLALQTRILESSSALPPPPPNVRLQDPRSYLANEAPRAVREVAETPEAAAAAAEGQRAREEGLPPSAIRELQAAAVEAGEIGAGGDKAAKVES